MNQDELSDLLLQYLAMARDLHPSHFIKVRAQALAAIQSHIDKAVTLARVEGGIEQVKATIKHGNTVGAAMTDFRYFLYEQRANLQSQKAALVGKDKPK